MDQFLDDLFSPVLDGNLDELSDARSLAASIRGNDEVFSSDDMSRIKSSHLFSSMNSHDNLDNSFEDYVTDLFEPIPLNGNLCNLAKKSELSEAIKGGDGDADKGADGATFHQQQVQRAFLESAMEQNIKIQRQLMAQNEALQTLLFQQNDSPPTGISSPIDSYQANQTRSQSKSRIDSSNADGQQRRKDSSESVGSFSNPPPPVNIFIH